MVLHGQYIDQLQLQKVLLLSLLLQGSMGPSFFLLSIVFTVDLLTLPTIMALLPQNSMLLGPGFLTMVWHSIYYVVLSVVIHIHEITVPPIRVTIDDLRIAGEVDLPAKVKYPQSSGGGFMASLEVNHQMRCLVNYAYATRRAQSCFVDNCVELPSQILLTRPLQVGPLVAAGLLGSSNASW